MKKFLIFLLFVAVAAVIAYYIYDDPRPEGLRGERVEALADKMLQAIGADHWESIPIVAWSFSGSQHYIWDKQNHVAQVKWDAYEVVINLNDQSGEAREKGELLFGVDSEKALEKAWKYWCNDSFWLNAPAKIRDPGTRRYLTKLDNGEDGILVEYGGGGVTPGDAYLWELDENYLPKSYKMWVSIIPIGGVEATWESWENVNGAMISTLHKVGPLPIKISNLKTGNAPQDFGLPADYFTLWTQN
jgi:hypothetical protein